MGSLLLCTKSIYNCRKDEELVRLLRSYDKHISINALKKIGAPLLGLAKYIYYFQLWGWWFWIDFCSQKIDAPGSALL